MVRLPHRPQLPNRNTNADSGALPDRELHHINPKGRPVKQCEHCRGARKSKSHHAKCDCGEKKDKDKHKDMGDAKGELIFDGSIEDGSNDSTDTESRCCCHSGAKCICGVKKEGLDLKLDTGKQTLHSARTKPKLTTTHSESTLTVFANGHHKPCHRNNNSAHVSGLPYKIARPHTLHGSAAFASFTQGNTFAQPDTPAQRSMDTLSLSNNDYYTFLGSGGQRSVTGLPLTPLTDNLDSTGLQDSMFTSQTTPFGHDGNSPSESHLSDTVSAQWPWSSTVNPVNRNYGFGSLSTSPSQDCLPNLENEWAIPSAGLHNPLWSAGDLPLDPGKLSNSFTQPISHSGESNKHSNPGLTSASSSHSEIGEPTLFGDLEIKNPQSAVSESLFWEDNPVFRSTPNAPSDVRAAPTSMPIYVDETQSIKHANIVPTTLAISSSADLSASYFATDFGEPSAIAMPNNLEDVISNDPWLMNPNTDLFNAPNGFDTSFSNWI
jgi:hypothetical protein